MEAVAPNAGVRESPRQREGLCDSGLAAMKGRIEAGDLCDMRRPIQDGSDRGQVVRLMQRGEPYPFRQRRKGRRIDADGPIEVHSAMHNTVPDAFHRHSLDQERLPIISISRVAAPWSNAGGGPGASVTTLPPASLIVRRGLTPMPSTCPRNRMRTSASVHTART